MANPYKPCETHSRIASEGTPGDSRRGRILAYVLIVLYFSAPFRDSLLLMHAQDNNAFPADGDSIGIGIIGSFMGTLILSPFALALIWFGISGATRLQFVPRLDRTTIGWSVVSTPICAFIIYMEYEKQAFVLPYGYHMTLISATVIYMAAAYAWWCNCIAHGCARTDEPADATKWPTPSSSTRSSASATG